MIKILTITESTVGWRDDDGELYVYPRCMFPQDLKKDEEFEYCAGEFTRKGK
jgi:hypothetical protein